MKDLVLYVFLLTAWMAASTYWYTCQIKNVCISEAVAFTEGKTFAADTSAEHLMVVGTNIGAADDIKFIHSRANPLVSAKLKRAFNKVETFLSHRPEKMLEVTGAYATREKNSTLSVDLGLARAEAFSDWMALQGIERTQVLTRSVARDSLTFSHDTLQGGLTFRIVDKPEGKQLSSGELKALKDRLQADRKPLYFESASTSLQIDDTLRQYVHDLKTYLDANPGQSIMLTGHTDNRGDQETNFRIGRSRADDVRRLLSQAGINFQQIRTNSKGESMPIADNDTEEGRSKNRRVEIAID